MVFLHIYGRFILFRSLRTSATITSRYSAGSWGVPRRVPKAGAWEREAEVILIKSLFIASLRLPMSGLVQINFWNFRSVQSFILILI